MLRGRDYCAHTAFCQVDDGRCGFGQAAAAGVDPAMMKMAAGAAGGLAGGKVGMLIGMRVLSSCLLFLFLQLFLSLFLLFLFLLFLFLLWLFFVFFLFFLFSGWEPADKIITSCPVQLNRLPRLG